MKISHDRQTGIFDPAKHTEKVSLIGCGSVGSFTALALAKMGVKIVEVFDSDKIEEHNLSNQFFRLNQLHVHKVLALNMLLKEFAGTKINTHNNLDSETILAGHIVISAVDSMDARKLIWERVKKSMPRLYIDSRMGGKLFSIHTVNMLDKQAMKYYESTIVSDEEATDIPCTERTIIFNVLGVASVICNQVVKFFAGEKLTREIHFDYNTYTIVGLAELKTEAKK